MVFATDPVRRAVRDLFALPAAGESARDWHVNPALDLAAYAFGWAWVLVPLLLCGDAHPFDYLAFYILVTTLSFVHRHYTLPYAYLDAQVFAAHRRRFVRFPLAMLLLFLPSPYLWGAELPMTWLGGPDAAPLPLRPLLAAVIFFSGAWNVWHTYMQKYGILRLYEAKSGGGAGTSSGALPARGGGRGVPGWSDRLLVLAWVPLYLVWLAPAHADEVSRYLGSVREHTGPLIAALRAAQSWLLPPAIALVAFSLASFVVHEWRAHRMRVAPRLWMAAGTLSVSAAFLVVNPVKVYMALAFGHAVEYMVFVWAFQRRRYARPLTHDPLLGRLLRRPLTAYAIFTLGAAALFVLGSYWGILIFRDRPRPELFGAPLALWFGFWAVYQSMVHFYFDGFLWKMRLPELRAQL
jgi:hypothetical protein